MQFILTDLQKEIKENAEKLLSEKIDLLETIKKVDEDVRLDSELWKLVNEQGWLALDVPEEDGGLGFSAVDASILSEVSGYYLPIIPLLSSGIVFKHLLLNSNDDIKNKYLPEIISGEKIGSFGVYENDKYEINNESIQTSLISSKDGLILSGTKKYVMFGDTSDYIAVLAKDGSNFKFVFIKTSDEGVQVTNTPSLDQTRPLAEITFTNVAVDPENIMIIMNNELTIWKKVQNIAMAFLSMEQVGGSQACLEMSTRYAKERIQFGRPIGSFQAIQHMCANMLLQIESAKSLAYNSVRVDRHDVTELEISSLLAKSYCSEVYNKVAGDNIQVHGGIGFTWEHPAHLYFKKAKSDSLLFGSSKSARSKIAELINL
jgi:alkylation response protein AidB-like acyl-CoA dehydrogenase